jgi:hypothetical protein
MSEIINPSISYADTFDRFVQDQDYDRHDLGRQPGDPVVTEDPTVPIYVPETPRRIIPENLKHPLDRITRNPRDPYGSY